MREKRWSRRSRNQTSGGHRRTMTVEISCRRAMHSGKRPVCMSAIKARRRRVRRKSRNTNTALPFRSAILCRPHRFRNVGCPMTVSYTHLDVYKRQLLRFLHKVVNKIWTVANKSWTTNVRKIRESIISTKNCRNASGCNGGFVASHGTHNGNMNGNNRKYAKK